MAEIQLSERSPWSGLLDPGRHGAKSASPNLAAASPSTGGLRPLAHEAGVVVAPLRLTTVALLTARRGKLDAALTAARALGVDLPLGPKWVASRATTFLWAGPDQWLVLAPGEFAAFERDWNTLAGAGTWIDQGHARAALSIAGPRARDLLAKGLEIDLHPRVFGPGQVALTLISQISSVLWQIDAAPRYAIAVPRSMAGSLWHWLTESAAEYGLQIDAATDASFR